MEPSSPMTGPASDSARTATRLVVPRRLILFLGALIAIGPLSLDAYLPAMPAMAEAFGVGIVRINDTISVYLVGYGLGVFFGGSFSDQVGRKRIGLIGLTTFTLASLAIGFATTVDQVQWLRFIQAIGGGFSTVICMAIVRDVYPIEQLGRRMAMVTLVMLASPVIAPSLGAALLRFGWPAIFFFKAAYAGSLATYYATRVPETRPGEWSKLSVPTTLRQCAQVIARKDEWGRRPVTYPLSLALGAGVFMTFITNSSFAYIQYFGVSETRFPLYFGCGVLGMVAANIFGIRNLNSANAPRLFRFGLAVELAAVVTLVAIVLEGPHIWLVVICMAMVMASFGLAAPAGSSTYIRNYDRLADSASSLYTTLMFSIGALLGAVSGVFFDGTLRPMALTMLFAAVAANACSLLTGATLGRSAPARDATRDAA
jgi:DHA1 family bicyclomycin/chloramphenicol resistance-like MFS transporter